MSKTKKWILIGAISTAAVVLGLWALGSFISSRLPFGSGDGFETATVGASTIETTVVGSGTLAYGDAESVSLPTGVDVTSIFYENGERVSAGDLLAAVDTGSLELLMSETYAQIAEVDAKLRETPSEPEKVVVTAPVAGHVQAVYAANGGSVLETVAANGSLILISPDGRMQVTVKTASLPAVGSSVQIVLPDGTRKGAVVDNVRNGSFTASLTDKTLNVGTSVEVQDQNGGTLGTGQLEAVDAVSVVAPAGTIEGVTVGAGAEVKAGTDLFAVRSASPPAAYQELDGQRRRLTERYDALADLYEHGGLVAPVSGVITSCSLQQGTASAAAGSVEDALGSLPASLFGAVGMSTAAETGPGQGSGILLLGTAPEEDGGEEPEPAEPPEPTEDPPEPTQDPPEPTEAPPSPTSGPRVIPRLSLPLIPPIPGLPLQHEVDLLPLCTGEISWEPADEQAQFATEYTASGRIDALEGFRFAPDCTLSVPVGEVSACTVSEDGTSISFTAAYAKTPDGSVPEIDWKALLKVLGLESLDLSTLRDLISSGLLPSDALGFDLSSLTGGLNLSGLSGLSGLDAGALAGLNADALSGLDAGTLAGLQGALGTSGSALGEALQGTNETPAYTIASDDSMQLAIQINQMDVLSVEPGMACTVTVDALEGEEFPGTVASIADTDTSSSGSYTAKIQLQKSSEMRSGMSASAVIVTSETKGEMTLPATAIQEDGNRMFVYTSYDAGSKTFGGERDVETGVSDGTSVEILSGLEPGETVYFARTSPLDRLMQSMGGMPGPDEDQVPIAAAGN